MSLHIFLTVSLIVLNTYTVVIKGSCPCANPDWCKPITAPPRKEVFLFAVVNNATTWNKFDWNRTTTVIGIHNPDFMCVAHQHDVRVVPLVGLSKSALTNPSLRTAWIQKQLKLAQDNYFDGVNIDFEGAIHENETSLIQGLTDLVNETVQTFKKVLPHSQVTIDVPFGPGCRYHRCFDYKALASLVDFLVIMDYDEWFGHVAGPNSGIQKTLEGLKEYLAIAQPQKLLMTVPWYGYRFICTEIKGNQCVRGKAGQLAFSEIYNLLYQTHSQRMWSEADLSPFFTYNDTTTNTTYQVWYDDPKSLIYKFVVASKYGIRGVGVWTVDMVDYGDTALANAVRNWMWDALPLR